MARRRRPRTRNVELHFANGKTEQYGYMGKSSSQKSLKLLNKSGKVIYVRINRLVSYEFI